MSVCVAVTTLAPLFSGVVAVIDQTPPVTVPVPIAAVPARRVTTAPSSPVPVTVGSATLVMLSPGVLSLARIRFAGGNAVVSPPVAGPIETSPNPASVDVGVLNATVPLLANGIVSIVPPAPVMISV